GVWPAILVAAFLVNATTAGSLATSLGIAIGNTLEGALAAYLVVRLARGVHAFDRPRDVFRFTGCVAVVSTVSAAFGVSSLTLAGYAQRADYGRIWFTWWLGDVAGALVVGPLLLLWSLDRGVDWRGRRATEALLLLLSLVLIGELVFGPWSLVPLAFLCIPPLIWTAFRFGPREAGTATALLCALALWGTAHGDGPFPRVTPGSSLVALGAFCGPFAVTALSLAAAVPARARAQDRRRRVADERALAYEALEKSEALHRAIAELTSDFALIIGIHDDGTATVETATEGFEQLTGYTAPELSRPESWNSLVHADAIIVLEGAIKVLMSGERVAIEVRINPKHGGARWLRCHAQPLRNAT